MTRQEPPLSVRVPKALRDRIYREAAAVGIPASAIVTQALADWYRQHPDGPDKPDAPRVVSLHPIDESGQRRLLLACGWPQTAVRAVMEQKRILTLVTMSGSQEPL